MSTAQNQPVTREAADAAYAALMQNVYEPVLFNKLASAGIVPSSAEERAKLINLGQRLYAEHQASQIKQAAAQGSLVDHAIARLDQFIGTQPDAHDRAIKQAAYSAIQHTEIAQQAVTVARFLRAQNAA